MRIIALLAALLLPLTAQSDGRAAADAAAAQLAEASAQLKAAESADDRISALTATVRAYETGLSAMKDGLRLSLIHI